VKRGLWIALITIMVIVVFIILNLKKSYFIPLPNIPLPNLVVLDFLNDPINRLFTEPIGTSCNVDSDCVRRFISCHDRCSAVNINTKNSYCLFNTNNPGFCPANIPDLRCVNNICREMGYDLQYSELREL